MLFSYKALKNNKYFSRKIEADSENAVVSYLRKNGYFPIEINPIRRAEISIIDSLFNRISFNDVVNFTRQFAIMLNAGLTIVDVLDILKEQIKKQKLRKLVEDIDNKIKSGVTLSRALEDYPRHFSNLYISLIRSGEVSGKIDEILLKLADNLEKQQDFRRKTKGAFVYPIVVVCAMIIVMFIMVTFVIPRMLDLYKNFNVELPWTTQILISISSFTSKFWLLITAVTIGSIFLINRYIKTKQGKYLFDSTILKIPLFNKVIRMTALVDSTRTLSILIGAGVSILDALRIIIETTSNSLYKESFQEIYAKVEKGQSLGGALESEGIFPLILVQMTIVGENTGHLDDTLARISHYFEAESEAAIKTMTTLIEPAILILLGVSVAFLVLSIITPIYKLTGSFQ